MNLKLDLDSSKYAILKQRGADNYYAVKTEIWDEHLALIQSLKSKRMNVYNDLQAFKLEKAEENDALRLTDETEMINYNLIEPVPVHNNQSSS